MSLNNEDILFQEAPGHDGSLGIITLNRPAALNALNHTMIKALTEQLLIWKASDSIKGVFIQAAEGRAFCAGGDIRLTYERMKARDRSMKVFFKEEYQLNQLIYHYPKPYIALLDGITMGGGVGISVHGSHRLVTEKLVFAMPETSIGFFPDVGGTYFLPRLKGRLGIYLGLTGTRLGSEDSFYAGIANYLISSNKKSEILSRLIESSFGDQPKQAVSALLQPFQLPSSHTLLMQQQAEIDSCFSHPSIESILTALEAADSSLCREALETLKKRSPASLKISLRAMLLGETMDFDDCMRQEYRLVNRFLESHDFLEGIRAAIIDKDQQPNWDPASLSAVDEVALHKYFHALAQELD